MGCRAIWGFLFCSPVFPIDLGLGVHALVATVLLNHGTVVEMLFGD